MKCWSEEDTAFKEFDINQIKFSECLSITKLFVVIMIFNYVQENNNLHIAVSFLNLKYMIRDVVLYANADLTVLHRV